MDKLHFETPNLTAQNINRIAELFPGVITEKRDENGKLTRAVNFELLKQQLSPEVLAGDEAYEFTWVGKKSSIVEANRPIRKTLRPCKEESKDWDTTENLYIEGDNLDVLKLLQESYLGKVKMIYIDPPYNTGHDFVYPDSYILESAEFDNGIGYFTEDGEINFKRINDDSKPRFHSDWCSLIFPRLMLSRSLLTDDGVVFISIDDNEVNPLKSLCNEVFGEDNFIAQFVWAAGRKNDSKLVSISHEYILCYVKSKQFLQQNSIIWRERKNGIDSIYDQFNKLKQKYQSNYKAIQQDLRKWYKGLDNSDPAKNHQHYNCVDDSGIYFAADISWPGGGGPKYEVLHPISKKPVKVPARGWVFPNIKRMQEMIDQNRVHFGEDETKVPCLKAYLKDMEYAAPYSVFYKDGRASTKRLRSLLDGDVFENPKDEEIVRGLLEFTNTSDGIILDFFSGSATTAHSVFLQNVADNKSRRFILVQLPEPCDEKSEAYKAGYKNICEIGKERIRRAGAKIKSEAGLMAQNLDTGFRVFKLDETNMKDVFYSAEEYTQARLDDMISNIKEDRTDLDLLYGCLLEWGLPLSLPHVTEKIEGCHVHTVNGGDLIACFDEDIPESVIKKIAERKPLRVVFRDSSFASSPEKINVTEIFKLMAPGTSVRVI